MEKYPILCLIHALVGNDEIKKAFLAHDDVTGRNLVIGNQNTEEGRVYQMTGPCGKVEWLIVSPVNAPLPDLHSDVLSHSFEFLFYVSYMAAMAEK